MRVRLAVLLVALATATWPVTAGAVRFMDETPDIPTVGTTIDGFTEVLGPSAVEPEHAGEFTNPPVGPPIPVSPRQGSRPNRSAPPPGQH